MKKSKKLNWVGWLIIAAYVIALFIAIANAISCSSYKGIQRDIVMSEQMYYNIHYLQVDSFKLTKHNTYYYLSYPLWNDKYIFGLEIYGKGCYEIGEVIRITPMTKGYLDWIKVKK